MTKKPEPSKEEILETLSGILREGESPKNKQSDAEREKVVAGLAEILFAKPRGYNPEPQPDWIARLFTFLTALLPALVLVALSMAVSLGGAVVLYKLAVDMVTLLAYLFTGVAVGSIGPLLAFEEPGKFRRRKGRKASRYVWFTLVWSALLFVIAWDWRVVGACVTLVFLTQLCIPWLVEKIFIPLRLGADILEAKFRRLTGIPEPPLELISEAEPGAE